MIRVHIWADFPCALPGDEPPGRIAYWNESKTKSLEQVEHARSDWSMSTNLSALMVIVAAWWPLFDLSSLPSPGNLIDSATWLLYVLYDSVKANVFPWPNSPVVVCVPSAQLFLLVFLLVRISSMRVLSMGSGCWLRNANTKCLCVCVGTKFCSSEAQYFLW